METLTPDLPAITSAAKEYFYSLLQQENQPNLKLYVTDPGTQRADISIVYCPEGEESSSDIPMDLGEYTLFVEAPSITYLREAVIDFQVTPEGGQLSIKAPHLKGKVPEGDATLHEKIQYMLDSEINPSLAAHNGFVRIVEILDNQIVVLQFGGGCHGCGMAHVTLKQGIEKTLKQHFPEIVEIRDATDHTTGENPYF